MCKLKYFYVHSVLQIAQNTQKVMLFYFELTAKLNFSCSKANKELVSKEVTNLNIR